MATPATPHTAVGHPAHEHLERSTRTFLDDIYRLLDQPVDPDRFYTELIAGVSELLGTANVAVWRTTESATPSLACQTGLEQETLFRSETTHQQHLRLVSEVFQDGRHRGVPLIAASPDSRHHNSPSYVLHLQPVVVEGKVVATIQVVRWDGSESQQVPWLLTALAAIAASYHHVQEVRSTREAVKWVAQFEEFVGVVHASLHPREIACAIAQHGLQLLKCDRLLVSLRKRRRYRVVAVTGQSTVHPRANAVRRAERLMKLLPPAKPVIRYPDSTAALSPREVEEFETYLDETHATSVAVCFFQDPAKGLEKSSAVSRKTILGGFIAEKYDGTLLAGSALSRVELVANHCAQALHNAQQHRRIFLLPLWSALGWLLEKLKLHLLRSLLLLFLIVSSFLSLFYVPADFDLIAHGKVQPEQRRDLFARIDGTLDELLVKEGQHVAKDEILARLSNPELDLALEKVVGELRTTSEKLAAVKSARLADRTRDRSGTTPDLAELAAQEEEFRQWIASLRQQQSLLEEQRQNLLVRSPLEGEVITWNVDPKLRHRPVRRGQLLMTVADLKGAWELELSLPDRQVGHLLEAQGEFARPLDVVFTPATNPNQRIVGQLEKTAGSIQHEEQEGASLLVTVRFDRHAVKFLQPGATVNAKIHCGRRSLGYVWLHDLWEFLQYRVFFRFWA